MLGALNDFCGLHWDKCEISNRTLVLEQLLTTGGGWQDQYGGFAQTPEVRWLNDTLYTDPQYSGCHLLYYTGITRTAKKILAEIVRSMFLLETHHMNLLAEMKGHALDVYEAFQKCDYDRVGRLVRRTWQQNQLLDSGTNPDSVRSITSLIDDLCTGYKLPGAGGGGYLYMMAKDPEAAARIKKILTEIRIGGGSAGYKSCTPASALLPQTPHKDGSPDKLREAGRWGQTGSAASLHPSTRTVGWAL